MRNLTIRREKSFAASSVPMKVYIEDPVFGDVLINDLPCRLLGELANGEKATYPIETEAAKLFAIGGRQSPDQCGEYLSIPEGEGDLFVRGQNIFNPIVGNPFRFQDVTDAEVLEYRKKERNKGLAALAGALAVVAVLALIGVFLLTGGIGNKKDFSAEGMTITLTQDFEEAFVDGFTVACKSSEVAMFALKEEFTLMAGAENYTVEEYANLVCQNNPLAMGAELQTQEDITWFEYSYMNSTENQTYRFFVCVFKSDDAFWLVQFATPEALAEEHMSQFISWAKTVSFSQTLPENGG